MKRIFSLPKNAENPYTMIAKELVMDMRLSPLAFKIMVYLLGQKEDWNTNKKDLIKKLNSSDHLISNALKELRTYGYMHHECRRHHSGHFYWPTWVYESPEMNPYFGAEAPPKSPLELILEQISAEMAYPIKNIPRHAETLSERGYTPEEVEIVWQRCQREGKKPGGMFFHWLRKDWLPEAEEKAEPRPEPEAEANTSEASSTKEMTPEEYREMLRGMNK